MKAWRTKKTRERESKRSYETESKNWKTNYMWMGYKPESDLEQK